MITKVDHMIIGGEISTAAWTSATKGQIVLADENFKEFDATTAQALYIGVCTAVKDSTPVIKWSDRIQKASHPRFSVAANEAPTAATTTIDLTNAKIVAGHRYVLRVLYKDIEVANLQFTHTYEVVAESADAAALAEALQTKINKHANRRVNATLEGSVLTLTAMEKDDNEGVDSLNEYSIVSMQVALYVTIPGALLSNQPESVSGAVITNVAGTPGVGYWKQVRDMERRAMGYTGHVFTGAYPSVEQKMMTTEDAEYNIFIIENDNLYLSPDNQYVKTTPVRTIVCATGEVTALQTAVESFGGIQMDKE